MESQIDFEKEFFKHIAWDLYSNLWSIDNWPKQQKGMKVSKNLFSEDSPFFNHEIKDRKDYPTGSNIVATAIEYWLGNTHSMINIKFHDIEMNKEIEICAEVFDDTANGVCVIHQFLIDPNDTDSSGFRGYLETRNTECYTKIYEDKKNLAKNLNYPLVIKMLNETSIEYKKIVDNPNGYKNIEFSKECNNIIDWGFNCHTWVIQLIHKMTKISVAMLQDKLLESMMKLGQRMKKREKDKQIIEEEDEAKI